MTILVLIHLIGNLWHGDAHTTLDVTLSNLQTAFVMVVIILGPVLGTILTWTTSALLGSWIVGCSMFGSVLFSVYHHFILISNDNVEHLPASTVEAQAHFANSAEFIALAAFVAALFAFYAVGRLQSVNSDMA